MQRDFWLSTRKSCVIAVKLIQKLSPREELRAPVQRLTLSLEKQAGVKIHCFKNNDDRVTSKFSIVKVTLRFGPVNHYP